ncbi:lysylphosphatidylglycerol synthase transmembrane domain-containing protein [Methylomonas sp. MO1]|uniref:lysylphosphatidylglycerol synthase transmembrane domain-containing protein n=1 Tax=unclassified Methylomonas TaxID=2608980 RepID=UPI00047B8BF3|nr:MULTISPECIES: lysylphosphatidylglycerol synthase transmembrane domain-containing protein [unclassified Methylomonas]MDT4292026.1 lysylphosphatidylglycerol synthase transmembrane domain-containing protein [Methylomonas sp. MO1]
MTWHRALPILLWVPALLMVGAVLSQLPLATITLTIGTLSFNQWLAWIGLNLAIILLAAQRWWVLSNVLKLPVGVGQLLMIRQAGQAVSFITPGPQFGGEPLQIFWLHKRCHLPLHGALLTLGLDRFYELWINFSILVLAVLLLLASPVGAVTNWREILLVLAGILLALSLFGWFILKRPERVLAWLNRLARRWQHHPRLQHIETHWHHLGSDLKATVASGKAALCKAFLLSLCGWAGLLLELWLLLGVFDLALDMSTFLVILVAMRLSFLLPLPGGIGSLEAALFWAFQYLSLPADAAIGLIALMRLRDAIILIGGLGCLRLLQASR